jgi:hypothetical protein
LENVSKVQLVASQSICVLLNPYFPNEGTEALFSN